MSEAGPRIPKDRRASIAIDLGAESCRVSLLRWQDGTPDISWSIVSAMGRCSVRTGCTGRSIRS